MLSSCVSDLRQDYVLSSYSGCGGFGDSSDYTARDGFVFVVVPWGGCRVNSFVESFRFDYSSLVGVNSRYPGNCLAAVFFHDAIESGEHGS